MAKPKLDLIILMQAVHERFAEEGAGLAGGMDHRVRLEGGQPHRLFAKHMLAGFGGPDRPSRMVRMRHCDIDGVDVRIAKQRLVTLHDARARESFGKAGLAWITGGDGRQRAGSRMGDAAGEGLGNVAGSENAPAYG